MAMENKNVKANTSSFSKMEEQVLDFWDQAEIFKKSVEKIAPRGNYVFYDGPPFGTGEPHYGHLLSSIAKDVVPRYWTMQGYRVERRWGWDCHGLPIENIIEKEMGISGRKEIEKIGVSNFNQACRARVLEFADIWEVMIKRIGRWVEFKNSYKTMDLDFMESVWWAFKQLWQKGLIYQGRKVLLYCPRCETPISNFEVAMDNSYQEITEESVYVKFKLKTPLTPFFKGGGEVYILAWTTTPWTLPGNVALAINKDIDYVEIVEAGTMDIKPINVHGMNRIQSNERYIIAKEIFAKEDQELVPGDNLSQAYNFKGKNYRIINTIKGKDLVGLEYEPLFDVPAFKNSGKEVFKVFAADFVTTEDGTGVVHLAPVYGEEDYNLGLKLDLPVIPALDEKGYFNDTVPQFRGVYFKEADKKIIRDLIKRELLFDTEQTVHPYPFCHRCDTQLFYNAIPAWFLSIEKIRKRMLELNENINWFPEHLKRGRFALGIEQAPDWNISRNRYFATPIPIWQCDKCDEREIIGDLKALKTKLPGLYILRHGEARNNTEKILSSGLNDKLFLTDKGVNDIKQIANNLKKEKIDLIISSNFDRTKQTAEIISKKLGINIVFNEKLRESNTGDYDGKKIEGDIKTFMEKWDKGEDIGYPNGENRHTIGKRAKEFYDDLFTNGLVNKKILIISHGDLLTSLQAVIAGGDYFKELRKRLNKNYIEKGELKKLDYRISDIHSHFVDGITWPCSKCGGVMRRIKEVFDCWVESGSMSFAQHHYPFANKEKFEKSFPAQYISEYISQTRAWFYVMYVMSVALFDSHSFENVIATGVIFNEKGEKMSKSKKNFPDPIKVINEFGADTLRFYLMSSSLMHGENLFFNERELRDVFRKNVMILWNVYKFYQMYEAEGEKAAGECKLPRCENILDKWILAKLNVLIKEVAEGMNAYNIPRAVRPIDGFINDFSTWYLRRSRNRFKGNASAGSAQVADKKLALDTTKYVLLQLSRVMAPFMPFLAEQIWQKVTGFDFKDENKSVHLTAWPEYNKPMEKDGIKILAEMEQVRRIVELGLAARDEVGIKVRQTLQKFSIFNFQFSIKEEYLNLIKDELNVREVVVKKGRGELKVELDTAMTDDLKLEGLKREIVRQVNAMRKQAGLTIKDKIILSWQSESELVKKVFVKMAEELKKDTLSEGIVEGEGGNEVEVNGEKIKLEIKRL